MRVDHSSIPHAQEHIHDVLTNWRRWVAPRSQTGFVQPMFRHYKTAYDEPVASQPIDAIQAVKVEKIIGAKLPANHAISLRWWYVYPIPASRVCRELAISHDALASLVIDSRWMVWNLLHDNSQRVILAASDREYAHI